jgi:DNA-binding NarL/FixJ family response regulator
MIRVLIADDHTLVRQGIRALLEHSDDVTVVAEAGDGITALALAREHNPDVLVLDIGMPNLSGIQALERLRRESPQMRVVFLSMHSDEALVRQALRYGARGYLLKNSIKEELILAVRAASRGEIYLSPAISNVLVDGYLLQADEAASGLDALTTREREVLKLIAEGNTNAEIAGILHISVKTVESHRANLLQKLGATDTAALIRLAIQHKLVFINGGES